MRIVIKESGRCVFYLVLPTHLVINQFTIRFISRGIQRLNTTKVPDYAIVFNETTLSNLSRRETRKMLTAIYDYRRRNGVIHLVEVSDHEGNEVYVDL